jgi:hypothetical protein
MSHLNKKGMTQSQHQQKLAAIFKNKFQKPLAPELIQAPLKAAENKQPAALV